jgi:hypothetical protein
MRYVHVEGKVLELNAIWLPTWLGQNTFFKKQLEAKLAPRFVGRELTDDVLDEAHQAVIEYIKEIYNIEGLEHYLDGIKFVEM